MASSTHAPVVLYDVLPNTDNRQARPYALLPNPWITRLVLKAKGIAFIVKPITTTELRASGPNTFRDRFGDTLGPNGRPLVSMIQHDGRLVGDNMTIAEYLDAAYPDSPSAYLPELSAKQASAAENQIAFRLAHDHARQLRLLIPAGHVALIYERVTELFDPEQRAWMRSDDKLGLPGAYELFKSKNWADLLAEARQHLRAFFSILEPIAHPRIEGLSTSASSQDVDRLVNRPTQGTTEPKRLFLASPSKPGFADFTVFGWYLFTYVPDRALNEAIWAERSDKARAWLQAHEGGKDALRGGQAEAGHWMGDASLPGVPEWADRMLSLYDNYARRVADGEIVDGEPETL